MDGLAFDAIQDLVRLSSKQLWSIQIRTALLIVSLFALWLLMSGIFKPLLIILGLFSCIVSALIARRLGLLDHQAAVFQEFRVIQSIKYLFWLIVEIGKADWAVTKVILSPDMPKRQRLIAVPCTQTTDLGKTVFANSITITPGTVTVETENDFFVVHSLTDEAADMGALNDMNDRVRALERKEQAS